MKLHPWQGTPLSVIGLSPGSPILSQSALSALANAELLVGSARQFSDLEAAGLLVASADGGKVPRLIYPSPFSALWETLLQYEQRRIVLLASGDPLLFGLGGYLRQHVSPVHLTFFPAISSIQVAFAKIGQPWQDAIVVSLHGRPMQTFRARLQHGLLYALLTDSSSTPVAIAVELVHAGFEESDVWVCENLGTSTEDIRQFSASLLATSETCFSPVNVVIVRTRGAGGVFPEFPGIADECFSTNGAQPGRGLLTKREVRLAVLSLLQPRAGDIGWDVGAGCGGVAVEWARWSIRSEIHAVECHADRLHHLHINRERFGVVTNLHIHKGSAPEALTALPCPSVIFVGGGGANLASILGVCWSRLPLGGRLVAAAVTEGARMALQVFGGNNADWTELSIARNDLLAGQRIMRPHLPVLLMKRVKS